MKVISVATSDSRAYYSILSRLKQTRLRFVSVTPEEAVREGKQFIITTRNEASLFEGWTLSLEDLDDNPLIMEGQILARMYGERRRVLVVGIDPGLRIGFAAYYGGNELGSLTFNSVESLQEMLTALMRAIPHSRAVIKVGDGAPRFSRPLIKAINEQLPDVIIEIVDEKGTSVKGFRAKRLTRDQEAAIRIAFRRGKMVGKAAAS